MVIKRHNPRFEQLCEAARAQIDEISLDEVRRSAEGARGFVLLDIREDHEWAAGRIPGARHLGRGILERDVESAYPDPATPLVLYCGGGYRSALAALSLRAMGYTRVRSMAGGIRAWTDSGLPITTGQSTPENGKE